MYLRGFCDPVVEVETPLLNAVATTVKTYNFYRHCCVIHTAFTSLIAAVSTPGYRCGCCSIVVAAVATPQTHFTTA